MDPVHYSVRVLTTGWLPGWIGLLLFAAMAGWAWWQLRREFGGVKPGRLTGRVLPLLRLLIVGLFIWLLCRPEIMISRQWQEKPDLLVVADRGASMGVREEFGGLSEKLDVLELLERDLLPQRNRAASRLVRCLTATGGQLTNAVQLLQNDRDKAASGWPLGADFVRRIDRIGRELQDRAAELNALKAELPEPTQDKQSAPELEQVSRKTTLLAGATKMLAEEATVVKQGAPLHPEVLDPYIGRIGEAISNALVLRVEGQLLQSHMDTLLLGEAVLAPYRTRRVTRGELADRAASMIRQVLGSRFNVITLGDDQAAADRPGAGSAPEATAVLRSVLERQMSGALAGAVYLSDGSAGRTAEQQQRLSTLARTPIFPVLIGKDGVAPADVGLIAVDMPPVAVQGAIFPVRALVHQTLKPGTSLRFSVRESAQTLATTNWMSDVNSRCTLDIPVVLDKPGMHSLVCEVGMGEEDAFPGNERVVRTLTVFPETSKVLIVGGRAQSDLVAYRGVLESLPWLQTDILSGETKVADQGSGTDRSTFPAQADQWKTVRLAILLGGIPDDLPGPARAGLREAVSNGLHVIIQEGADEWGTNGWSALLGLTIDTATNSAKLLPVADTWLDLYQVDLDPVSSLSRLAALPSLDGLRVASPSGWGLLDTDVGPGLTLLSRGKGFIVYNGIPAWSLLRQGGNGQTVNRLIANLVGLALCPLDEGQNAERCVLFPAQPVEARRLTVAGGTTQAGSGLQEIPSAGKSAAVAGDPALPVRVYTVAAVPEITLQVGGATIKKPVCRLRDAGDFALTPSGAVLNAIANATGGKALDLMDVPQLASLVPKAEPVARSATTKISLWAGVWPLVLLALLVTAEYLLRRRAGRIM